MLFCSARPKQGRAIDPQVRAQTREMSCRRSTANSVWFAYSPGSLKYSGRALVRNRDPESRADKNEQETVRKRKNVMDPYKIGEICTRTNETKEHIEMYYVGEESAYGDDFKEMRKENSKDKSITHTELVTGHRGDG